MSASKLAEPRRYRIWDREKSAWVSRGNTRTTLIQNADHWPELEAGKFVVASKSVKRYQLYPVRESDL